MIARGGVSSTRPTWTVNVRMPLIAIAATAPRSAAWLTSAGRERPSSWVVVAESIRSRYPGVRWFSRARRRYIWAAPASTASRIRG